MVLGVNHFPWQRSREEPWCEVTSRASAVSLCCHCWIRWWPAHAKDIQRRWLSSASPKHMLSPGVSTRLLETFGMFNREGPSHFLHYPSKSKDLPMGGVNTLFAQLLATMPEGKGKIKIQAEWGGTCDILQLKNKPQQGATSRRNQPVHASSTPRSCDKTVKLP